MTGHLTITDIGRQLNSAAAELADYCATLRDEQFFFQPAGKWSAAQQVKHLVIATHTARLAFTLPKFIVRWVGGIPNRPSRNFDELVARYRLKLEQGGRASGRYVPAPVPAGHGKEKLLRQFMVAMDRFARILQKKWQEQQLDEHIVPHPLLGKITLRELCYFTIYHAQHHLQSMKVLIATVPVATV